VAVGGITDVSEVHAASIFRVEVYMVGEFLSILLHRLVTIDGGLDCIIEFINALYIQLWTTGNTALL
jgi:hypothetical protein